MLNQQIKSICLTVLGAAALSICGCSGGLDVSGKLVKDGEPISIGEKGMVIMNLTSEDGAKTYGADVDKDGTFKIRGPDGGGIPAGTYRISIEWYDPYEGMGSSKDKLKGKFSGKDNALTKTIDSEEPLTIDLAKAG